MQLLAYSRLQASDQLQYIQEPQAQNPHLHVYSTHTRQQRNRMVRPAAQGGQGLSRAAAPPQLPRPACCSLGQCDVVLVEVILQQQGNKGTGSSTCRACSYTNTKQQHGRTPLWSAPSNLLLQLRLHASLWRVLQFVPLTSNLLKNSVSTSFSCTLAPSIPSSSSLESSSNI